MHPPLLIVDGIQYTLMIVITPSVFANTTSGPPSKQGILTTAFHVTTPHSIKTLINTPPTNTLMNTPVAPSSSIRTGVRRSSVSLLSQGIAAITEANFNANKSAKTSSKFPHSNSDTSLSERENGLKLSPSPSTSFGLAHQLALGSSLDNDSQSVTTALTTSTANTSTPYKTTLTQTTIPYPTSSNAKNNKPFKIPVRINPPHSRASTASSRASTASGTTRPLTGSKWNSRESTAQNNRARARPPTASNAYPITNNSHMEGSTSQSVCSISTIGQGGVESVVDYSSVRTDGDDTQPFRFRRRAVDPIYPPGTAEKFGVQAIAKIHQHEEAFRISCVTGNLVSGDHCTPPPPTHYPPHIHTPHTTPPHIHISSLF